MERLAAVQSGLGLGRGNARLVADLRPRLRQEGAVGGVWWLRCHAWRTSGQMWSRVLVVGLLWEEETEGRGEDVRMEEAEVDREVALGEAVR